MIEGRIRRENMGRRREGRGKGKGGEEETGFVVVRWMRSITRRWTG